MLHHDGIGWVHLRDTGIKTADSTRNLRICQHFVGIQFVKTCLTDKQLFVGEVIGLYHIYLLLYLLGNLHYLVLVAPCGDGVFVYTRNAGSRHVQTLNVDLATGEHRSNLIQNTSHVLRVNQQRI